ncbi:MAG: carboxymuconolactone decarboxylase family protein [Terriglobia bacterium]
MDDESKKKPSGKKDPESEPLIPVSSPASSTSYSMLEPRMKRIYGNFYKELYFTPERRVLDPKIQELISIAVSLAAHCEGCLDGHLKKAISLGASKEEISEAISIAIAINAAAIVDLSDRASGRLKMAPFPER